MPDDKNAAQAAQWVAADGPNISAPPMEQRSGTATLVMIQLGCILRSASDHHRYDL
jgi:hypothetical protein